MSRKPADRDWAVYKIFMAVCLTVMIVALAAVLMGY